MTNAIVGAVQIISIVVIGIILMVLANTMAMTARERSSEYAVLKTWDFLLVPFSFDFRRVSGNRHAWRNRRCCVEFPGARLFQAQLESFLRVFEITGSTILLIIGVSLLVGLLAALPPAMRVSRMRIVEGLRHIG